MTAALPIVDYRGALHASGCPAWDNWQCNCGAQREPLVRLVDASAQIRALAAALALIADIAEGSGTANSLPHIAKIAREALK